MAQYACVKLSADANKNIVPLLFKELTGSIPPGPQCKLQFIGFENMEGAELKINGIPNIVPSSGQFITPYNGANHMIIHSVTFDEAISDLNIWFMY